MNDRALHNIALFGDNYLCREMIDEFDAAIKKRMRGHVFSVAWNTLISTDPSIDDLEHQVEVEMRGEKNGT